MPKKPEISNEDKTLFRDVMRGIKPLKHTKVNLQVPVPNKPKPVQNKPEEIEDVFSDYESMEPVGSEDILQFSRPGIQHKILRNLRNGKYNVEAILDLHGKKVIEARELLNHFLLKCQQKNVHHVLLIHGKGRNNKPILKNKLNNWLRQTDYVLAFCSATTREGRSGALYVLLKSMR